MLGVETRVIPSATFAFEDAGRLLVANGHTTGESASGRFRIRGLSAALIQRMFLLPHGTLDSSQVIRDCYLFLFDPKSRI
jgi:hypothetical protein